MVLLDFVICEWINYLLQLLFFGWQLVLEGLAAKKVCIVHARIRQFHPESFLAHHHHLLRLGIPAVVTDNLEQDCGNYVALQNLLGVIAITAILNTQVIHELEEVIEVLGEQRRHHVAYPLPDDLIEFRWLEDAGLFVEFGTVRINIVALVHQFTECFGALSKEQAMQLTLGLEKQIGRHSLLLRRPLVLPGTLNHITLLLDNFFNLFAEIFAITN